MEPWIKETVDRLEELLAKLLDSTDVQPDLKCLIQIQIARQLLQRYNSKKPVNGQPANTTSQQT